MSAIDAMPKTRECPKCGLKYRFEGDDKVRLARCKCGYNLLLPTRKAPDSPISAGLVLVVLIILAIVIGAVAMYL